MKIWPWSVIAELREEIEHNDQYIIKLERTVDVQKALLTSQQHVISTGIARILAKLDPIFGMSEDNPRRIADSKKLEEDIIAKLYAEHSALKSRGLV